MRYFCDNADAVLLLTATPVQLGSEDLFTLLNVARPDLVIDHASFEQMAEPNRYINSAIQQCRLAKQGWQKEALTSLDESSTKPSGANCLLATRQPSRTSAIGSETKSSAVQIALESPDQLKNYTLLAQ